MKSLKEFSESLQKKLVNVSSDSLNYLTIDQLKNYLNVASVFLMQETKNIIQYLIINNETYLQDLESDEINVLAGFYNKKTYKNEAQKQLYNWMYDVINNDRYLEIPVFLTQVEFNQIINKEVAPDRIYYRLDTEEGRNLVAKKYEPLMHKLCQQWYGKINLTYDDLRSVANEGLVYGMNTYGKQNKRSKADNEQIFKMKFGQYAAWTIRNHIIGMGVADSHTITISPSDLKKEREAQGFNNKKHTISGNQTISKSNDDGSKTIFDFIDSGENIANDVDKQELEGLWQKLYKHLETVFDKKIMDIWYHFNELNNYPKISNKQLASKYGVANSSITYYVSKVNNYIQKNKEVKKILIDIYELTKECLHDDDENDNIIEPHVIRTTPDINLIKE